MNKKNILIIIGIILGVFGLILILLSALNKENDIVDNNSNIENEDQDINDVYIYFYEYNYKEDDIVDFSELKDKKIAYTLNYNEIEEKNNIISKYSCNSNDCQIGYPYQPSPGHVLLDDSKIFIYDGSSQNIIVYDYISGESEKKNFVPIVSYYLSDDHYIYGFQYYNEIENVFDSYSLLDFNGNLLFNEKFDSIPYSKIYGYNQDFFNSNTNNLVIEKNNNYGVINLFTKEYVLETIYDRVFLSYNGYISATKDGITYLIDSKGNIILETYYYSLYAYDDFILTINIEDEYALIKLIDYNNNILTNEIKVDSYFFEFYDIRNSGFGIFSINENNLIFEKSFNEKLVFFYNIQDGKLRIKEG